MIAVPAGRHAIVGAADMASSRRRQGEDRGVIRKIIVAAACGLLVACGCLAPAAAQRRGGILKVYSADSPPGLNIYEQATPWGQGPLMGVYNNLILVDQHIAQNSLETIRPDLATTWQWNEDGTALTFKLRQGVKWHDGMPFTAKDVLCTIDLQLDKASQKVRFNPRKSNFKNLDSVSANGDYEVTFHLKRPQPAFPMLLANGFAEITPCHQTPDEMRQHPIGTGPFKFVEFKPNEYIKLTRNPDYWKPDRPYLDAIDFTIIRDPATAVLAFIAGKFDLAGGLSPPMMKDIATQLPDSICEEEPGTVNRHLIINREKPPFNNPELRRAMSLSIDRQAFIDIVAQGKGEIGGVLQSAPGGLWGLPPDQLKQLPGYDPDVAKNRAQARQIMQKLDYGPNNHLRIKVSASDIRFYKDPAVLLIDQLKEIYIDGELDAIDSTRYYPKIMRQEFTVGLNLQTSGPDPDPILDLFYGCGSSINWDGYCNKEVDQLIEQQSIEGDAARRKQILWQIERKLAEEDVRPIIFYADRGSCKRPDVKGDLVNSNSIFDAARREDVWLDRQP
jgi:peptide/nickel transport system substrate-binding protein